MSMLNAIGHLLGGYAMPPTPTDEEAGNPPRFRRIYFLAAPPGRRVGCKQRFMRGGSSGLDSQLLGTILGPFRVFFGPALYLNI